MATITKVMSFENLLQNASLGKDSNGDGVVDGWWVVPSDDAADSWIFDSKEPAQIINISYTVGAAESGVESERFIPVMESREYTFSAYMKVEGDLPAESGGKLVILWYDGEENLLDSDESGVFIDEDFARHSLTAAAPAGAELAKVRIVLHCSAEGLGGILWAKWAQFQEGTLTDYEDTDFFEIINPAGDATDSYTNGWEKVTSKKYDGVYAYKTASGGQYPTIALRFRTPPNAENIQMLVWVDLSEMAEGDRLVVYDGGAVLASAPPGPIGYSIITEDFRRGEVFLMFQLQRATPGVGHAYIDRFAVVWDEVEPNPAPEVPQADQVHIIDFESDEYNTFFQVQEQAPGYNYGFARRYEHRNSGYYSFGVRDHDIDVGYPENGSPPPIPKGEKAACMISFRVPISASDPALELYAFFDAATDGNVARIKINGNEVWSTNQRTEWEKLFFPLIAGTRYDVIVEYEKEEESAALYTDSVYIDDILVRYNIPKKPIFYAATAPQTEIKIGDGGTVSIVEDFESATINSFFTVQNPSRLKSGGGRSQYPETGWTRTVLEAYEGKRGFRAIYPSNNNEDSAVDFTFRVPYGVKNARVEWMNFVELERSSGIPKGAKYNRLYEEYRIWVNHSLWKDFHYCSPELTNSVRYTGPESKGDPANDYACPWGRWWKESLSLSPGQTYTITFELQRDAGDSGPIHGRNLCVIDNLTVTWEETPGEVVVIPPEPLIYFDGRDGIAQVNERNGAEMAPISFAEYSVFGVPGTIHQHTIIEPRTIDFMVLIHGENRQEVRQRIRELTRKLANKPLSLVVVYPDGETRMIDCRFEGYESSETEDTPYWRNAVLSFRCFDSFFYGDWVDVQGENEILVNNPGDQEAWPIIKIYGPVTNPFVQLLDGGNVLAEVKLSGFTVNAGRYITIITNPINRAVMLDDGQILYQYMDHSVSKIFSIPPGSYTLRANGALISAMFRPPYWGV